MALAYGLKRLGLFGPRDHQVLVKAVLNVTLPAAAVCSFLSTEADKSVLVLTALGVALNGLCLLAGLLLGLGRDRSTRALYALSLPGCNIGCFAMPFVISFLGPAAGTFSCFFDIGNAVMCTGGSYALVDTLLSRGGRQESVLRSLVKKLSSSTPFLTYTAMLVLTLLNIRLPQSIGTFLQPLANANPFCAMFMLGLMFDLNLSRDTMKSVGLVVILRSVAAAVLAFLCYRFLPLPLAARQALCLVLFAPPSVLTPAFTEKCGGSAGAASCANSLCILSGFVGMIAVLTLLHIY